MRFVNPRSAAVVTLAYLLASVLGGLLHTHDHAHSHDTHANCHHDADETNPGNHDDSSPAPVSDDDCLVCRLAAQSGLVYLPLVEPGLCPLVGEIHPAAPTFFVEPVHSCGLARAPPIV